MATRVTTQTHPLELRPRVLTPAVADTSTTMLALGRFIFGGYFLYNGFNHFLNHDLLVAYAGTHAVPAADLAVTVGGLLLLLGGVSLLLGLWPKIGASFIILFLVGVTPVMHDFWNVSGAARMAEMGNFLKNIALIGGACFAAALPEPWPGRVVRGRMQ
jgi:putative oxidoreductase